MKKNVCIIGPFPPPINGNTKALDTIQKSKQFNDLINIHKVNLSNPNFGTSGKFSLEKVKTLILAVGMLRRIQRKCKIDTYYLTIAQSTVGCLRDIVLLSQIFKFKKNARVVLHLHGGGFKQFYKKANPILKMLIKKHYTKADEFIVLSESLKSMFDGIVSTNNIQVVENCVDDEFIISEKSIEHRLMRLQENKRPLQILYLSNMIKSKGYLDVLYASKELFDQNILCKFVFAGNFSNQEQEDEFNQFISDSGLNNYVEYKGVVGGETKKSLLKNSDIFILPTFYPEEGQPISILEAMSAGMTVVTTKHGGIPDVIVHGENGFFVKAQNPKDITSTIKKLVNHPSVLIKIGKSNRKKVIEQYLESNYIKNIMRVLGD